MKKILFLLILIYSYSNAWEYTSQSNWSSRKTGLACSTTTQFAESTCTSGSSYMYEMYDSKKFYKQSCSTPMNATTGQMGKSQFTTYYCRTPVNNEPLCTTKLLDGAILLCKDANDLDPEVVPNPDPLGGSQCRDLFQKNGVAYTCNPNTNEATPIPYSDGLEIDPEDGKDVPNCNDGYSWDSTINFPSQGTTDGGYNSYTCSKDATNPDGSFTGDNGVVIGADGSITTPNPAGGSTTVFVDGSTSTTHPDGSITTTPPTNTTGGTGTDSGTGTSGGTGGTDSGSGSSTGGTSGTGSTGGTTGTDTGSGSTGGTDTGTTDTTGTSGTGSTGGMGTDGTGGTTGGGTATGGGGGGTTGGTDSGTTTDGTTGTDTGSGSTGGTDSGTGTTGGTTGTTDPTTGADDCNDSNMTLTEKTLCKISNIFSPTPNNTPDALANSGGLIDGVIGEYSTFKTNISTQGDTLKSLVYTSIDTVNQGFSFNISSNEVVSCPKDYTLDLSALNMANMNVVLDICLQTSKLKPYFYPLFLIMFSVGTTLITFRMLGVLI